MILPLEKQVCSLEYSKKLRELGCPQESVWYWELYNNYEPELKYVKAGKIKDPGNNYYYSAYTCAELLDRLPDIISWCESLKCSKLGNIYYVTYEDEREGYEGMDSIKADTLANALAQMLIYLYEQGLINPDNIGVKEDTPK